MHSQTVILVELCLNEMNPSTCPLKSDHCRALLYFMTLMILLKQFLNKHSFKYRQKQFRITNIMFNM